MKKLGYIEPSTFMQKLFQKNLRLTLLAYLLIILATALHLKASAIPKLIDTQGRPNPAVLTIYKTLGLKPNNTPEALYELGMIEFKATGKEVWQAPEIAPEARQTLLKQFEALGFVDAHEPSFADYNELWIHGAALSSMAARMDFACQRIAAGTLRAKHIYILTGERPLDPSIESVELWQRLSAGTSLPYPATEGEAAIGLWKAVTLRWELKNIETQVIRVPMLAIKNGHGMRRPETSDTIYARLDQQPTIAGRILSISNNPYIAYQQAVAENCVLRHFGSAYASAIYIETVGPASSPNTSNRAYLYRLVRTLHEEIEHSALSLPKDSTVIY